MGFLDDAKNKLEDLGHKAGEALETAKDKASEVVEDVKDRLDVNNDGQLTASEAFEAVKSQVTGHGSEGVSAPTETSDDVAPVDTAGASATPAGEAVVDPAVVDPSAAPTTIPVEPAADPLHPMNESPTQ